MKKISIILVFFAISTYFATSAQAVQEQHEFGSGIINWCYCGGSESRSYDSTAENSFNVKYIKVRSEFAEPSGCPVGGNHYVTIKLNGSDICSSPAQYVDHTYYMYYSFTCNVDFTMNIGDTITYYWTYNNVGCIGGPNYVTLSDTIPAKIEVSPTSHDYGLIASGSTESLKLTIDNAGGADLTIGTISITGADASVFSLQNDSCSNQILGPSGNCTFDVLASPTISGTMEATIEIPSDDPDKPTVYVPIGASGYSGQIIYSQDFSEGLPDSEWTYYSSTAYGRINVIGGRLRMDVSSNNNYSVNESTLTLDLAGYSNVWLYFFEAEFGDELHALPIDSFSGHYNGDGIAISADATTWYTIMNAVDLNVGSSGRKFGIDLNTEITRIRDNYDPSFGYTNMFYIKFQQYDNYTYGSDGREWDNIVLAGELTAESGFLNGILILLLSED